MFERDLMPEILGVLQSRGELNVSERANLRIQSNECDRPYRLNIVTEATKATEAQQLLKP